MFVKCHKTIGHNYALLTTAPVVNDCTGGICLLATIKNEQQIKIQAMEHAKEHHMFMPCIPGRSEFSVYSARSAFTFSHVLTIPCHPLLHLQSLTLPASLQTFLGKLGVGTQYESKYTVTLMGKAQQASSHPYTWIP